MVRGKFSFRLAFLDFDDCADSGNGNDSGCFYVIGGALPPSGTNMIELVEMRERLAQLSHGWIVGQVYGLVHGFLLFGVAFFEKRKRDIPALQQNKVNRPPCPLRDVDHALLLVWRCFYVHVAGDFRLHFQTDYRAVKKSKEFCCTASHKFVRCASDRIKTTYEKRNSTCRYHAP